MTNGRTGDGQGGIYAILVVIVILIIAAIFFFAVRGGDGTRDIDANIEIQTPQVETPEVDPPDGDRP